MTELDGSHEGVIAEGTWVMSLPRRTGAKLVIGKIIRFGDGHDNDVTVWTGLAKFDGTAASLRDGTERIWLSRDPIRLLSPLDLLASVDMAGVHEIPEGWRICLNNSCWNWTAPGTAVYCSNESAWRDA